MSKSSSKIYIVCFFIVLFTQFTAGQNKTIDLSGRWRFEIDKKDSGQKEKWFWRQLNDNIWLPGSISIGFSINNFNLGDFFANTLPKFCNQKSLNH